MRNREDQEKIGIREGWRRRLGKKTAEKAGLVEDVTAGFAEDAGQDLGKEPAGPATEEDSQDLAEEPAELSAEDADKDPAEEPAELSAKDADKDPAEEPAGLSAEDADKDPAEEAAAPGKRKRAATKKGRKAAAKKKKPALWRVLSIVWSFLGVLALLAAFLGTWRYMKEHDLVQRRTVVSSEPHEKGLETKAYQGTLLAKKSNSLDGVPIYAGPGSSEQTGLLPEGKCIQVTEFVETEGVKWIHVAYCGLDGWLEEKFVRPISRDALYIKTGTLVYMNALTEKGIKGYARPDMGSEVVREGILYGEEFTVEELSHGWGRVTDKGKTFWLNMYFMGSYPSSYWMVESLRSKDGINLRKEPSEEAKRLGKVPENQKVRILEFRKGWGRVEYKGQNGWLHLNYMSPDEVPDQS